MVKKTGKVEPGKFLANPAFGFDWAPMPERPQLKATWIRSCLEQLNNLTCFMAFVKFDAPFSRRKSGVIRLAEGPIRKEIAMTKALVCGAGGFIGSHLVKRLKADGRWVRGADLKYPEFSKTAADEFLIRDLREPSACGEVVRTPDGQPFDEVYQLAADMGGMGFIHSAECEIMRNSALINIHMTQAAGRAGVRRYLFSSSACVYRDMDPGEPELTEEEVYPAQPDNEYGWEKLYAERMAMAFGRKYGMAVRLARFQNTYGPEGTWRGGREKAPAALSRKIAEIEDGGVVEIWGDGTAMRAYTFIDDLLDGIRRLMDSDLENGVNIGRREYVSVDQLAGIIAETAGKSVIIRHVPGPVGVKARNFRCDRLESIGWQSRISLREGIGRTYPWVESQVKAAGGSKEPESRP
jgi:nucleoside-diphosphate-sugar epimerase